MDELLEHAIDELKGIECLLSCMHFSMSIVTHEHTKKGIDILSSDVYRVIEKLERIKEEIETK